MKQSYFILLLCLTFAACKQDPTTNCTKLAPAGASVEQEGDDPTPTECPEDPTTPPDEGTPTDPTDPTEPDTGSVPTEAELFSHDVSFTNFTPSDEEKVEEALELIRLVIRTPEFRTRVLNHKYNGTKSYANNNGQTNAEIYQTLLDGEEKLNPGKNHRMDLQLELYTNNSNNVVGYTYPNVLKIWMNRKYFNTYKPYQVSRNLIHEWTHKLGYGHDSAATAKRPYSVPYAVGEIMQDLAFQVH